MGEDGLFMGGVKISDTTWERLETSVSQQIGAAFTNADPGTDIHKLGVSLSLLAMLETSALGNKTNQTLQQYDNEARDVLALRRTLVEERRDIWATSDCVKQKLAKARKTGIARVLGSGCDARVKSHAEFLTSEEYLKTTATLGEKQRAERLKLDLVRLAGLDPQAAQGVACEWMAFELKENPLRVIQSVSETEAVQALEDVLGLFAKMTEDADAMKKAQCGGGPQGAMIVPGTAIHNLLATTAARRTVARGLTHAMRSRNYYGALGGDDARLIAKLKADRVPGAELLERLSKYSFVGRGVTSVFSLWGLAAVTECFPPIDKQGNVRWAQLAISSSTALSITGNIPEIAKFLSADVGPLLSKCVSVEFQATKLARGGCVMGRAAQAAKFVKVCEFLGPIGDVIALPIAISSICSEVKNEDAVGVTTNVVGAISGIAGLTGGILILAGSGVGLPLAVAAALIGITAALIDAAFGESALTGQIRRDLRYLDISTDEDTTCRNLTTSTRTVTRGYGCMGGYGGTYTAQQRYNISKSQVRARAKNADKYEKIRLLNHYFEGWTDGSDETLVWQVFFDTPYTNNQFLHLIEGVDAGRAARELENDTQAAKLMVWTARAYEMDGKPPGKAFNEQFLQHAKEHHDGALHRFFDRVLSTTCDGDQLPRDVYKKVEPKVLMEATKLLMSGDTNGDEEKAIYKILSKTDYTQFSRVLEQGQVRYVRELKSELSTSQWHNVHDWMSSKSASNTVNHYARIVRK